MTCGIFCFSFALVYVNCFIFSLADVLLMHFSCIFNSFMAFLFPSFTNCGSLSNFFFFPFQFHCPQPVWQHYVYSTVYFAYCYQQAENHKTKQRVFLDAHWKGCFWRWFLMLRGQLSFDCSVLDFISTGNVPCRHAGRLCLENELSFTLLIAWGDCLKMLEEREAIAVVRAAGQRRLNYIHTNRCARKRNN